LERMSQSGKHASGRGSVLSKSVPCFPGGDDAATCFAPLSPSSLIFAKKGMHNYLHTYSLLRVLIFKKSVNSYRKLGT
jgi:hypothetical protein